MAPGEYDQIMMSVDKPDALAAAEIHAIRQLADAVSSQSKHFMTTMEGVVRSLERVSDRVEEVRDKVIRLEEQKHGAEIKELRGKLDGLALKVDLLESQRDQANGARAAFAWLSKNAPWLAAVLAALGFAIFEKLKKP